MSKLEDFIPIDLTNSADATKWFQKIFASATGEDAKAMIAAIALLTHEVSQLQGTISGAREDLERTIAGAVDEMKGR